MSGFNRREILTAGALSFAATATGFGDAVAAQAPTPASPAIDPMSLVDPELRAPLAQMLKTFGSTKVDADHLAQARKPWSQEKPAASPPYEQRMIPGRGAAPEVRVYVVNLRPGEAPRPVIVHMHGGGYIGGVTESAIPALQRVASEHDCVVVSVDYRLAPETPFPGSLEDNYAALRWAHDSADMLGIDRTRIAVMGESAGGGHAAMLAIAARDRGEVAIACQILIYPMLDDRTGSTRHLPPFIGAFVWTPESNRFGWSSLLGKPAGSRVAPPGAVPARVEHLAGLPRTFIGVGSIDLFVDEDIEYARRLVLAGVPTELLIMPGAFHGFDGLVPTSALAQQFRLGWNGVLSRAFAGTMAP